MTTKSTKFWLCIEGTIHSDERPLNRSFRAEICDGKLEPANSLIDSYTMLGSIHLYRDEYGDFSEIIVSKDKLLVDFSFYFSARELRNFPLDKPSALKSKVPLLRPVEISVPLERTIVLSKSNTYEIRFPFYDESRCVWYYLSDYILLSFDFRGMLAAIRFLDVKKARVD